MCIKVFQEYVSMTSGFLTLGMWAMTGLCFAFLRFLFGSMPEDLVDMLVLAVMACTPTVWIARNNKIIKEFVLYLRGNISPSNLENNWGGVWVGP